MLERRARNGEGLLSPYGDQPCQPTTVKRIRDGLTSATYDQYGQLYGTARNFTGKGYQLFVVNAI